MKVTRADCRDLIDIIYLVREIVKDMNSRGLYHWNTDYPNYELVTRDIRDKSLFIIKNLGICIGMVTLTEKKNPEYNEVNWKGKEDKVLYINRLAVHPVWRDKKIARVLMEFAESHARENGYTTIRLDAHSSEADEIAIFNEINFSETGEIFYPFQKIPFKCYEKTIS